METKTMGCPICGGTMDHAKRPETVTYEWASVTIESEGWWCRDCGELLLKGEETRKWSDAFDEAKRQVEAAKLREAQATSEVVGGAAR